MPINLATINQYYGLNLRPEEAQQFLEKEIQRDAVANPKNLEEKAISLIGKPLYEAFIQGYSEKQWETELTKLPPSIITRLPVRFDYNDRYFDDPYEGLPLDGYHKIFERMLSAPLISVKLNVDFFEYRSKLPPDCLIVYTGPVDRYFNYKHGYLGWRTLDFERERLALGDFQGTSVMNYAERTVPYTRIHEFKHYHPERPFNAMGTVIYREFSRFAKQGEEPYYPINTESDKEMFQKYKEDMQKEPQVLFGGRLATYKYLDMHQVIGAALLTFERDVKAKLNVSN
jgi:UDP-galactopyranose mutase